MHLGVAVDLDIYKFDIGRYRHDKEYDITGEISYYCDKSDGYMLSIYQDIFMNALPKFSKDFFFSFGLGAYFLKSEAGDYWRLLDTMPLGSDHVPVAIRGIDLKAPGFNIGLNYDHTLIHNRLKFVFGVRYHQIMFAEDLQNFLKITAGFMF